MTDAEVASLDQALQGSRLTLAGATSSHTAVVFRLSHPSDADALVFFRRTAYIELATAMEPRGVHRGDQHQVWTVLKRAPWFAQHDRALLQALRLLPEESVLVIACHDGDRLVWCADADIVSPAGEEKLRSNFMRPDEEAFWRGGPSLADVLGPDGSGMR